MNAKTITDATTGETIVFLHGFCECKEIWSNFKKPLQQQFRTIAIDLKGFGNNINENDDFSMEAQADFVQAQLKELGVKKCLLVGHSMGGYISLAFAEKYPKMLSGLCLFHSSALPDDKGKKESRNKTMEFVEKHGVEKFISTFVEPLFAQPNREKCAKDIEKLKQIGAKLPAESVTGGLAAMRDRPDRTQVLKEAKYPVLFIFGKDDQAVPMEKALEQCHLPNNSMSYFLSNCGHMGMFEKTFETRKTVQKFAETIFG